MSIPSFSRRQVVRTVGLLLVIIAAAAVPRALMLRGVRSSAIFDFLDMPYHMMNADRLFKRLTLPADQLSDPYLVRHPESLTYTPVKRWPADSAVALVSASWAWISGSGSAWTTVLTNLTFSIFLVIALVGLGQAMGSTRAGLWGGLFALICPALFSATLYCSLDYPLVAMTTTGLLLLWWTEGLSRPRFGLAFAAWSVLGFWVKPSYVLYLLGPAVWTLVSGLRHKERRRRVLATTLVSLLLAAGLLLLLWGQDLRELWREAGDHLVARHLPGASIGAWTLEWLLATAKLAWANLPYPLLLLAGLGLFRMHRRRAGAAERLVLVAVWSGYLVLTLTANKMERYVQPIYPLLCLASAWYVVRWVPRRAVTALLVAVGLVYALVLWATHRAPTPWLPGMYDLSRETKDFRQSAFHPFRYELNMPDRVRLDRLRQWRWDSECDLRQLMHQIGSWLDEDPAARRPVGFVMLDDKRFRDRPDPHHTYHLLLRATPALLSLTPQRFVVSQSLTPMGGIPRQLRSVPTLVVLHHPLARPWEQVPEVKIVDQRVVNFFCGTRTYNIALSLVRPRGR